MSSGNHSVPFGGAICGKHNKIDPCFMTGKGCVYTDVIDDALNSRSDPNARRFVGFSVMPFRPNLRIFHKNCLTTYFTNNFHGDVTLRKADEVQRPGIIICEGICRRIQESDFVTADVSRPNPNVFYELGLAYGMAHKISVMHHHDSAFGRMTAIRLADLGCKAFAYHDLDPIRIEDYNDSKYIWQDNPPHPDRGTTDPKIYLYEHKLSHAEIDAIGMQPKEFDDDHAGPDARDRDDIDLDFSTHVRSAVGLSIQEFINAHCVGGETNNVVSRYKSIIERFREVDPIKSDRNYREIRDQVDSAYCLIIHTGFPGCHPMSYFWLGYGHAKGKNVVPVTLVRDRGATIKDLAFDIRAQRHMVFTRSMPERFESELQSSLSHMIQTDFSGWSRKQFWDKMIGRRGGVSIFTGALHNETYGREMIGDWDLRAASELTSYFARAQYRAKIENPVYTPEYFGGISAPAGATTYIRSLEEMLMDKNCILIASADVNPLTEIVLGKMYAVPEEHLFRDHSTTGVSGYPNAIIVVKKRQATGPNVEERQLTTPKRFFYRELATEEAGNRRGFMSAQITNERYLKEYVSQKDLRENSFELLGHLAIMRNPYRKTDDPEPKFIIILNGVSGPATFALTHVLTGGVTKDFVAYDSAKFSAEVESESVLDQLLTSMRQIGFGSLDCLFCVSVGRASTSKKVAEPAATDWRKILSWELDRSARKPVIKIGA